MLASPLQFNHAIIAVHVSDQVSLPTLLVSQNLGRLLIFDPTNRVTPVGDLPASANRIETSIEACMDLNGQLVAKLARQYFGQSSTTPRAVSKLRGEEELTRRMETEWARQLGGVTLGHAVAGRQDENPFSVSFDLTAEHFGQIMQDRLLILRPGMLASGGVYGFTSK